MMTSPIPYDIHHGVVINRAKFDVSTYSSFRVKTDRHTGRQNSALYMRSPRLSLQNVE